MPLTSGATVTSPMEGTGSHARKVVERLIAVLRGIGVGSNYPLSDNPDRVHAGAPGLDQAFAPRLWLPGPIEVVLDFDSPLGEEAIRLTMPIDGVYPVRSNVPAPSRPGERMLCALDGGSDIHNALSRDRELGGLVYFCTIQSAAFDGAEIERAIDYGAGRNLFTAWWETERGF